MPGKKTFALLVCILLLAAFAFPSGFIIARSGHHCNGDGCMICQEITICVEFFAVVSGVVQIAPLWVLLFFIASLSQLPPWFTERKFSLVSLKVKLTT